MAQGRNHLHGGNSRQRLGRITGFDQVAAFIGLIGQLRLFFLNHRQITGFIGELQGLPDFPPGSLVNRGIQVAIFKPILLDGV